MRKHNIKVFSTNFDTVKARNSGHTSVLKSRNIKVDDRLCLKEWDNIKGEYTGERMSAKVIDTKDGWLNQFADSDEDYDILKYEIIYPYKKK